MSAKYPQLTGILITGLFSVAVLTVFYGNLFGKLNRICFAAGGDGLQSYVNMDYHIRYDSTYLRCNSMNYPYGEHVFFTNNQPLISNTVKFISQNLVDISGYMLGILNFIMLFCLAVTPVILYLILTDFRIGNWVSILASVGITYLTPQLDRFGGHFNLSYVCAIPLMILLLMRFFRKPSVWLTACIFLTVLAGALTHFYFYGFFAVLILFFYAGHALKKEKTFGKKLMWALHLFVQLILPFLILQAFYLSDQVTDRTSYPWGFLYYRSYPQSVFLPLGTPYGRFLNDLVDVSNIDWEGYAYVGLVAAAGTIFFLVKLLYKLTAGNYRLVWKITPEFQLNILFWASFAALLYSFGLPFILGLQFLIDLLGPVRQMRGIARFSWLFYYVMNIVTVYWLWLAWKNRSKGKIVPVAFLITSLLILYLEAFFHVRNRGRQLENHIPELVDRNLVLPENQWIRRVSANNYQAFIPLPYFHIGSENIWLDKGCGIIPKSFVTILRSGLPCLGVSLSRTSLNQTADNMALMLEPSGATDTERFPSKKPFLLLVSDCDKLSNREKQLINHSIRVGSSGSFRIYHLPFSAFHDITDSLSRQTALEYSDPGLSVYRDLKSGDPLVTFRYLNYDSLTSTVALAGEGCYSGIAGKDNLIFSGFLPYADTGKVYIASFWINNIRDDLYPRTRITIAQADPLDKITTQESYQIFQKLISVMGSWALVELPFRLQHPANKIIVRLQNETLRNNILYVDDLLIRPEVTSIYRKDEQGIWKNNRLYAPDHEQDNP